MRSAGTAALTDEQQIAALREAIRETGRRVASLSDCLLVAVVSAAVLICGMPAVATLLSRIPSSNDTLLGIACTATGVTGTVTIFAFVGLVFVASPLAAVRCSVCQRAFRRRLEELSREERLAVLLPLRDDESVQEFVGPLLRQLRLPSELTPATTTDARGDEASPAETSVQYAPPRCK